MEKPETARQGRVARRSMLGMPVWQGRYGSLIRRAPGAEALSTSRPTDTAFSTESQPDPLFLCYSVLACEAPAMVFQQ